jgi:hypothetical protein
VETNPKNLPESNLSIHLSYPVIEDNDDITFTTENGTVYSVYFTYGSGYLPEASFSSLLIMFGCERKHRVRNPAGSDPRILPTIIYALHLAFQREANLIILYVCSQANGLQKKRSLLFEELYQQFKAGYTKIDYREGDSFFCSAIFRDENPYSQEIKESIQEFIQNK